MSDEKIRHFEREFDEEPTRMSSFTLLTDEQMSVFIHQGRVDCAIFPPEEVAEQITKDGEVTPFVLTLTPREARDLAGVLIYAAGRADEHAEHCVDCGETIQDHDHEHDEDEEGGDK
jgi:hypothetical protein